SLLPFARGSRSAAPRGAGGAAPGGRRARTAAGGVADPGPAAAAADPVPGTRAPRRPGIGLARRGQARLPLARRLDVRRSLRGDRWGPAAREAGPRPPGDGAPRGHSLVAIRRPRLARARGGPARPGRRGRAGGAVPRLPGQGDDAGARPAAREARRYRDAAWRRRSGG